MTTDQIQKAIEAIRDCKEYEEYASTVSVAASSLHKARVLEFNRTLAVLSVMFREASRVKEEEGA